MPTLEKGRKDRATGTSLIDPFAWLLNLTDKMSDKYCIGLRHVMGEEARAKSVNFSLAKLSASMHMLARGCHVC